MPRRATKKNILFFSSYLLHSDPPCVSWTSPGLARWHSLDDVMSGLLTTLMMISSFRGYVVELQCLHVCSQCGVNSGPSQSFGHLFLKTGRLFGLGVGVLLIVNDFIWFSEWARVVGIFFLRYSTQWSSSACSFWAFDHWGGGVFVYNSHFMCAILFFILCRTPPLFFSHHTDTLLTQIAFFFIIAAVLVDEHRSWKLSQAVSFSFCYNL